MPAKIRRALISVSNKAGIVDFARSLALHHVEILSTGGSAELLRKNNVKVIDVSEYTDFPEILDGRLKTLHPRIFGGILAEVFRFLAVGNIAGSDPKNVILMLFHQGFEGLNTTPLHRKH